MTRNTMNKDAIVDYLNNSDHKKVRVAVTDMDGILRGKYMHINKFLSALDSGFGFCDVVFGWDAADVCYENSSFTGWHSGYPDTNAVIDPNTFRKTPWNGDLPLFLADFASSRGEPLEICPRQLLKKIIKQGESEGYSAYFGLEYEWFNFSETPESLAEKGGVNPTPLTPGMFGYSVLRSSLNSDYFNDLMELMEKFEVPIEGLHTETGPGVYEAAILYSDTLEAADRAVLFKTGVKEIAYRHGILASFMARWSTELPGCSGHIHQSLWDMKKENNLFYSESDKAKMSELFKSFLAGQMMLLPELLCFYAPTVNSYKRLVEGYWAPTSVAWAVDNRTAAFRVIPGSRNSTRLETRVSGSDANPYLATAAALASGLYGIRKGLKLEQEPVTGNAYSVKDAKRLPRTLGEAALSLDKSEIARELFGEKFVDHFVQSRFWEWDKHLEAVTDWELKRYFELI